MSGYIADVIAHRGVLDAGVNFLQKRFSRDYLAVKVRDALASRCIKFTGIIFSFSLKSVP